MSSRFGAILSSRALSNSTVVLPLLCVVGVFAVLRNVTIAGILPLSLGAAQLFILPLLLLVALNVKFWRFTIPRVVLLATVVASLVGFGFRYSQESDPAQSFFVANLKGDELEIDSRIFRTEIRKRLKSKGHLSAVQHSLVISSPLDARRVLTQEGGLWGIVWGSTRWVSISFNSVQPRDLTDFLHLDRSVLDRSLLFVQSVPSIGLSYQPLDATSDFIAALFSGLLPVAEPAAQGSNALLHQETRLLEAATMEAPWTSSAHRSYPNWILGNRYFRAAFQNGEFIPGDLDCAITAYRRARGLLQRGDNPELLAAILNNEALALYMSSNFSGNLDLSKDNVKKLLRSAAALAEVNRDGSFSAASKVAKYNLKALGGGKTQASRIKAKSKLRGRILRKRSEQAGRKGARAIARPASADISTEELPSL